MNNKFCIYIRHNLPVGGHGGGGGGGTYIIKLGHLDSHLPSYLYSFTWSNMVAIWYKICELKSKIWKTNLFRGPYKIQMYLGTKMSANADLITVDNNQFFIYRKACDFFYIFGALWGGGGGEPSMIRIGIYCLLAILSLYMSNNKQSNETFLAPPAERQRRFSDADLSAIGLSLSTFHLKVDFITICLITFFIFGLKLR